MSINGIGRIAICICTFRRPAGIAALLDSLTEQVQKKMPRVSVFVVDNDPSGSAEAIVKSHPIGATYLLEPEPGIAQARNRSLEAALPNADWIAFVDDDEVVAPDWLDAYERMVTGTDIMVVTGPVDPLLPPSTPKWVIKGEFLRQPDRPSGLYPGPPPTSNTLIHASIFRESIDMRFNPEFGLTGGSDFEFFVRVGKRGIPFYWCQEARVSEEIPISRTTARWIWQRGVRTGNVTARLELTNSGRAKVLFGGVARIGYGSLRVVAAVLMGRGLRFKDAKLVMRGVGFLEAGLGRIRVEYSRKADA